MGQLNWPLIKAKLREAVLVLPHFFTNPVQFMRALPHWEWAETLILQAIFGAVCAVISNLLERDLLGMVTGLVVAPLAYILLVTIGAGFFYYVFKFSFQRDIPYRQVYLHVLFASIPLMIVSIVAFILPPILLIGAAAMGLLLFAGFVANFQLPPLKLRRLLVGLLVLYAISWTLLLIGNTNRHKTLRQKATPESLDILEKELNNQ